MQRMEDIIIRYLNGESTESENAALDAWRKASADHEELFAGLTSRDALKRELDIMDQFDADAAWQALRERKHPAALRRTHSLYRRISAAAAVLLLIGAGIYFWPRQQPVITAEVAPGRPGAILTLGDGTQVVLDSLGNGVIAHQQGSSITLQNGHLRYDAGGQKTGKPVYNTITTPKGRQFQVTLPDGTKVWLNAASSIRYEAAFSGNSRVAEITGEVYFEVASHAQAPFIVKAGKTSIEVLGTRFNVNAYENESSLNTTLAEGSIRVSNNGRAVLLKPGQEAQITAGQPQIALITGIDTEKTIAWKNGLFNFEGASLQRVMKQLERWYDIEVVYDQDLPDITFWGEMTRDIPLSGLIIGLEKSSKLRFRIEGRKLHVQKR